MARKTAEPQDQVDADIAMLSTDVAVPVAEVVQLSFADLGAYAERNQDALVLASEMDDDDGFLFLDNKSQLVGSQFFIVDGKITNGQYGEAIIIKLVTSNDNRVKIYDGGTGIKRQLVESGMFNDDGSWPEGQVVAVLGGLTESNYETDDGIKATTYYLDTSGGKLPAGVL